MKEKKSHLTGLNSTGDEKRETLPQKSPGKRGRPKSNLSDKQGAGSPDCMRKSSVLDVSPPERVCPKCKGTGIVQSPGNSNSHTCWDCLEAGRLA